MASPNPVTPDRAEVEGRVKAITEMVKLLDLLGWEPKDDRAEFSLPSSVVPVLQHLAERVASEIGDRSTPGEDLLEARRALRSILERVEAVAA